MRLVRSLALLAALISTSALALDQRLAPQRLGPVQGDVVLQGGGAVTTTGPVQAGSVTATGGVTAGSVTTPGTVSGAAVSASGAVSGATLGVTGAASVGSLTSSGAINAPSAAIVGGVTAGSFTTPGALSAGTLTGNGSGVSVTATGGNTPRLNKDRAADVFNVFDFGAKGDCATDDSAAINDALAAAAATPQYSGKVYLPRPLGGCYSVATPINLPGPISGSVSTNVSLYGDGPEVTKIRATASMLAVVLSSASYNRGHTISEISIDGAKLATYPFYQRAGSQLIARRVWFLNGVSANARIEGYENFVTDSFFWNQDTVFTTPASQPDYNLSVGPKPGGGTSGSDNHFDNNVFFNAKIANVLDDASGNNHYINNHTYGYPVAYYPQYGFIANAASVFVGNTADGASVAGFDVRAYGAQIVGNRVQLAPAGIKIGANLGSILVTNNMVAGVTAANVVVPAGPPLAGTIITNNPGASYSSFGSLLNGYSQTTTANTLGFIGSYGACAGKSFCIGDGPHDQFRAGLFVHAAGNNGWLGDAQVVDVVMRGAGTSGTVNILTTGTGTPFQTNIIAMRTDIPASTFVRVRLNALCSSGDTASWTTDFTLKANKSVSSVVFVDAGGANNAPAWTKLSGTTGSSGWTPGVVLDTTNGGAILQGGGSSCAGGKTVYWVADVRLVETAAGTN